MLFPPDIVIACPRCGALERVYPLRSSNKGPESEWTDGYVANVHGWVGPVVTRCDACHGCYRLEDAPELGRLPNLWRRGLRRFATPDDPDPHPELPVREAWERAPIVKGCDLEVLHQLIAAGVATTPDRELTLRTQAFWHSSHRNRDRRRKKPRQKTPADRRNMLALLAMRRGRFAVTGWAEDALACAEIERQVGNFESALTWLNQARIPDPLARRAMEIRARAQRGDRTVGFVAPPRLVKPRPDRDEVP